MTEVSFGEWLKRQRNARGLTREQLAHQIGCAVITLRKIEAEERRPSAQMAERLGDVFNIPTSEQASFLRFARGDWRSPPVMERDESPWRIPTDLPRVNLPTTPTSLVGREAEVTAVHNYLLKNDIHLVTLIGPPGIGKTRLSIEVARTVLSHFPGGVFFIALAPLEDPTLLEVTVTHALGYVGTTNTSPLEQLKDGIGQKKMLIVLDNCEHLIEGLAGLVSSILSMCPRVKILTTSRESLRVSGEWLYPVPVLGIPNDIASVDLNSLSDFSALTLFAERARAMQPDFNLHSNNIKAVSTICARLDGLPLAIELIAARIRVMSPELLLERLDKGIVLSADGVRAVSARHKTLRDAIAWSYSLLTEEEQKLFAFLSVFSGGFTLEAAETIFSRIVSQKSVMDLITSLLDKSLLQLTSDKSGESRYTMLVTIQEFARERLQRWEEAAEIHSWHFAYFLDLAVKGDQQLRGPEQIEWLDRLESMSDNFRIALDWAIETRQVESALQLVRKLHWFWFIRGNFTGARRWLKRVLEMPETHAYHHVRAETLTQLAYHSLQLAGKEAQEGRTFIEQALHIARANRDRQNTDRALPILALFLAEEGKFAEAQSILQDCQARFQEVGDEWEFAHTVLFMVIQSVIQEDWATALARSRQAFPGFKRLGDTYFQSVALRYMGRAYINLGEVAKGLSALRESLLLAQQLANAFQIALILWRGFSEAALRMEKIARAVTLISASINLFQSIGAWSEQDDLLFEKELAPCRTALGELTFAAAMRKGHAMTMEQAIAYAFEDVT